MIDEPKAQELLSYSQVKAARALLAWSQQDLARKANVAQSTVADFERGQRTPVANNSEAIRNTLEEAGISFLPGGAIAGPLPAVLRKSSKSNGDTPFRWINATDLSQWAERRDGQGSMPQLLTRLIRAATGQGAELCFPSDESVQQGGWDGTCRLPGGSEPVPYIPFGVSAWEIGTQREGITKKATEDYNKRTNKNSHGVTPKESTFVFVTPRHWAQKEEWVKERNAEGKWAEVRAYDADDLVHWIELYPAVSHWLAVTLGKRPPGLYQLNEAWKEWSLSTRWPLSTDLVLASRDEEATRVLRWLREDASTLLIQGESPDEAIAFLYATIEQLPPDYRVQYHARCLVIPSNEAARALVGSISPLIIVLSDPEPGLAQRLVDAGHHVYIVCGSDTGVSEDAQRLSRPMRDALEHALAGMDIEKKEVERLAHDSGRSLAVLRRLIPSATSRIPEWAESKFTRGLLAALLAGGWDENRQGDKTILEALAGESYGALMQTLAPWVGRLDSPLNKVGNSWKIVSPRDTWFLLARHITQEDVERFEKAITSALGSVDPRYDVDPGDRWLAGAKGIVPVYSKTLRRGLTETLILLSVFGLRATAVSNLTGHAEYIVKKLFEEADKKIWWAMSQDFQRLAEASPDNFLSAIEESLERSEPPVMVLFGEDGGPFGAEHVSGLLWALETLAWSPDYLGRAALVLANLASLDPGGQYRNRPINSLTHIFLLWLPQTYATLAERLGVLDRIIKTHPDVGWKLMLSIMPKGHDGGHYSPLPQWRDFSVEKIERPTYGLMDQGAQELSKRLLQEIGLDTNKWKDIVEILANFSPSWRAKIIQQLSDIAPQITHGPGRLELWACLRHFLHHHRSFPDAEWSIPSDEVNRMEVVYKQLEPDDEIKKSAWLFAPHVELPQPEGSDWRANDEKADEARRLAVQDFFQRTGAEGILQLANAVDYPGHVGKALAELPMAAGEKEKILKQALQRLSSREVAFANGLIDILLKEGGQKWANTFLDQAIIEKWKSDAIVTFLLSLPATVWTWKLVEKMGKEVEAFYWQRVNFRRVNDDDVAALPIAVKKFIDAGRARDAIYFLGRKQSKKGVSNKLLADVLMTAAKEPWDEKSGNDLVMFQHNLEMIFEELEKSKELNEIELGHLEWAYLPFLRNAKRSHLALHKVLASDPKFFVEVLSYIFKSEEGSGVERNEPADHEHARAVASQAFDLLHSWNLVPGTTGQGSPDPILLEKWVKEARGLCAQAGRGAIGDQQIGQILAHAPSDANGIWPAVAVRDVIEITRSREIERGMVVGSLNSRGGTSRGILDGGLQEREEAEKFRLHAKKISFEWPRTAAILERIAKSLESQGAWYDEDTEKSQW